jgi:hypothetical protein
MLASLWPWHVHAYQWPGPFGWVARATPGNLVAGILQTIIYAAIAALIWPSARKAIHRFIDRKLAPFHEHFRKQAAHSKWMAVHLARSLDAQGIKVDRHPEHGDLQGVGSDTDAHV